MTNITRPAALVRQGSLKLYATSLKVSDLMIKNFYKIESLDPEKEETGYQRILNKSRARRLAEYLIEGQRDHDAFLPTSIFLATDKDIEFDATKNQITIDIEKVGPFNVVDGQHRIAGLVEAAQSSQSIRDFEIPVNIAVSLDGISQMCHFLIVNTTQKSVDKAVEQQIVARLTNMITVENVPNLPRWIRKQVERGDDERALALIRYLNTNEDSPWKGKIGMANQVTDLESVTIQQKSFVASLKKNILVASNPLAAMEFEQQKKILRNYWKAIASLLSDESEDRQSVLFKTTGLEVFNIASVTVFTHCATRGSFTTETITDLMRSAFGNLPTEFAAATSPDWWLRGEGASGMNQGASRKLAQAISIAINSSRELKGVAI